VSRGVPQLESILAHSFAQAGLLRTALTHRSYGTPNNERLEFLGDGLLNCVVADLLCARFVDLSEGELSRLRANLVRQDTLHTLAEQLTIGQFLLLGEGERRSGGQQRPSILADALEAIFGAVYLDAGFSAVHQLITRLFTPLIDAIDLRRDIKDAKTRLQEHLQGRRLPLPIYTVLTTHGEAHAQEFEVACDVARLGIRTVGRGTSRRVAEQQAADLALQSIEIEKAK